MEPRKLDAPIKVTKGQLSRNQDEDAVTITSRVFAEITSDRSGGLSDKTRDEVATVKAALAEAFPEATLSDDKPIIPGAHAGFRITIRAESKAALAEKLASQAQKDGTLPEWDHLTADSSDDKFGFAMLSKVIDAAKEKGVATERNTGRMSRTA
jgi:hypothetical protein